MTATVIDLTKHRFDQTEREDKAYLARVFAAPAYMALPFITLKKEEERWGTYADAETFWNDVPTGDDTADCARGVRYAQMAIAALESDRGLCRGLEATLEEIFMDAVRRRKRGGKYSRSLAPAPHAFLCELARHINEGVGGWPGR